jgi:hypothetical protein
MRIRISRLAAAALAVYAGFGVLLAAAVAGRPSVPMWGVAALGGLALAASSALAVRHARRAWRGPPPDGFDAAQAVSCAGAEAEAIRRRARWRGAGGGRGFARPIALAFPPIAHGGLAAMFLSGLLNIALHVEGRWVQYAGSGRDLDLRATYEALSVGLLADPANLKYGVLVGDVRPSEPARLADVEVIDAFGRRVEAGTVGPDRGLDVRAMHFFQWAYGPGVHLTLLHRQKGRLFDQPFPLWPGATPGEYAERIEGGDDVTVDVRTAGWPRPDGAAAPLQVAVRRQDDVLYQGTVEPRQVQVARDGYAVILWEVRPYVGLGMAHRTFRTMTLASAAVAALGLALWVAFGARPFWYREGEGDAVAVSPPRAWAALARRRG